jgi:hypothetical protein
MHTAAMLASWKESVLPRFELLCFEQFGCFGNLFGNGKKDKALHQRPRRPFFVWAHTAH